MSAPHRPWEDPPSRRMPLSNERSLTNIPRAADNTYRHTADGDNISPPLNLVDRRILPLPRVGGRTIPLGPSPTNVGPSNQPSYTRTGNRHGGILSNNYATRGSGNGGNALYYDAIAYADRPIIFYPSQRPHPGRDSHHAQLPPNFRPYYVQGMAPPSQGPSGYDAPTQSSSVYPPPAPHPQAPQPRFAHPETGNLVAFSGSLTRGGHSSQRTANGYTSGPIRPVLTRRSPPMPLRLNRSNTQFQTGLSPLSAFHDLPDRPSDAPKLQSARELARRSGENSPVTTASSARQVSGGQPRYPGLGLGRVPWAGSMRTPSGEARGFSGAQQSHAHQAEAEAAHVIQPAPAAGGKRKRNNRSVINDAREKVKRVVKRVVTLKEAPKATRKTWATHTPPPVPKPTVESDELVSDHEMKVTLKDELESDSDGEHDVHMDAGNLRSATEGDDSVSGSGDANSNAPIATQRSERAIGDGVKKLSILQRKLIEINAGRVYSYLNPKKGMESRNMDPSLRGFACQWGTEADSLALERALWSHFTRRQKRLVMSRSKRDRPKTLRLVWLREFTDLLISRPASRHCKRCINNGMECSDVAGDKPLTGTESCVGCKSSKAECTAADPKTPAAWKNAICPLVSDMRVYYDCKEEVGQLGTPHRPIDYETELPPLPSTNPFDPGYENSPEWEAWYALLPKMKKGTGKRKDATEEATPQKTTKAPKHKAKPKKTTQATKSKVTRAKKRAALDDEPYAAPGAGPSLTTLSLTTKPEAEASKPKGIKEAISSLFSRKDKRKAYPSAAPAPGPASKRQRVSTRDAHLSSDGDVPMANAEAGPSRRTLPSLAAMQSFSAVPVLPPVAGPSRPHHQVHAAPVTSRPQRRSRQEVFDVLLAGPTHADYAMMWKMVRGHVLDVTDHLHVTPPEQEYVQTLVDRVRRQSQESPYHSSLLEGPRNVNITILNAVEAVLFGNSYPSHLIGPLARRIAPASVVAWAGEGGVASHHLLTGCAQDTIVGVVAAQGRWAAFSIVKGTCELYAVKGAMVNFMDDAVQQRLHQIGHFIGLPLTVELQCTPSDEAAIVLDALDHLVAGAPVSKQKYAPHAVAQLRARHANVLARDQVIAISTSKAMLRQPALAEALVERAGLV